ncbi:nucleic-acid-binding protein from transposon X-element [Trichonephila clavipes]|nr:nucleic-acid-binding protein from transposon X-element [Trichonephila clavipes]
MLTPNTHSIGRLGSLVCPLPPHWSLHPKLRPLPSTMSQHKANDNTRQRMEESEIDSSSLFKSSIRASPKISKFDPSLTETTIAAADEHQLKLDALVSERDSLPECQTFNCQFCPKSIHTTPVIVNTPVNNNNVVTQDKIDNSASKTTLKSNSNKINNNKNKKFNKRKFIKLFTKDVEEKRSLTHYLESDKDFEYFCIKPKLEKPIKVVIKGLPIFTKTLEIHSDLEEEGFTVEKVSQLISKKHKGPLPFFQITLPRNANNLKIFDLKTLGYLQVRVEGFLVRGITQCFNCNNFFHTASDCHLKPRCLKCGKDHPTKQCQIKERQENPFCINCQEYGHSACYTKCPHFPKPRKGSPLPKTPTFNNNKYKEGVSFANIVSGINSPPLSTPNENDNIQSNENKNSKENHGINKEETSDLAQVIELINLISNILKKSPEIIQILKNLKSTKDETAQTYLLVEALLNKN